MKLYIGTVTDMDWQVKVRENDVIKPLPLCIEHVNHSPDGFSWGYYGSGPAQLSFAILNDAFGTHEAKLFYREFQKIISQLPKEISFEMPFEKIKKYLIFLACEDMFNKQRNSSIQYNSFKFNLT